MLITLIELSHKLANPSENISSFTCFSLDEEVAAFIIDKVLIENPDKLLISQNWLNQHNFINSRFFLLANRRLDIDEALFSDDECKDDYDLIEREPYISVCEVLKIKCRCVSVVQVFYE